jgi:uncharacterized protein
MMSENAERVRAFYEGAATGPPDMDVFHQDVEFRMPEVLPHGGVIHGREALGSYVDGDDRVVALGRFCGSPKASGRYVEVPFALVWTMRDGRAVAVDEYTDTALLLEALRA